jgi:enamine deaminase RidA (YjgF/YER057c/UK114 family)/predicted RNA-binding Zn ribbon-like protein
MLIETHTFSLKDLVGGHLALDFINTVTARDAGPRDWLPDYAALLSWAGLTGRFSAAQLRQLDRQAAQDPIAADAALARCKLLRETLHRLVSALIADRAPPRRDLETLDGLRLEAMHHTKLAVAGDGIAAEVRIDAAGLDFVADVVLVDALDLLRAPPPARLRTCEGSHCGWLFHDTSKAGRRRWCDMGVCGSAEKVRRHRGGHAAAQLLLVCAAFVMSTDVVEAAEPKTAISVARWTPEGISSDLYDASPAFTPDGRELYFMRANRAFSEYTLLRSRCAAAGWGAPQPVPFGLPAPVSEGDPFVTRDGRKLYFISTRPAPGKRGNDLDIWVVERNDRGDWGNPARLPEPVNSPHAELMPRVTQEGRIYFGSDRPGGMGGNDVYLASPLAGGGWQVSNLGADVNSPSNDYEAEVSVDEKQLVLVSDREVRSHLYRFERTDGRWHAKDRIPAKSEVFQVGPLLSPRGDRLLFAQADSTRSGEMFLADLTPAPDRSWPPSGAGCAPVTRPVNAPDAPAPSGSYSQAVEATRGQRMLFISGQIPVTTEGDVPPDFLSQGRQVWRNVEAQLRAAGMSLDNVVKVTTFLGDRRHAAANSALRQEVLGDRKPALTVVIAGIYDPAWLLEIEAIAVD